jgi:hypothetical protein
MLWAATQIQRVARGRIARREATRYRRAATALAVPLQARARGFHVRARYEARRSQVIRRSEVVMAGREHFAVSYDKELKRQVLVVSRVMNPALNAELQKIFLFYTSTVGRYEVEPKAGPLVLELSRFMKLCKEVPGLLSKGFDTRAAELSFHELKTDKTLSYEGFLSFLQKLADVRLTKTETYSRLTNQEARLVKLLVETVFPSEIGQKLIGRLKPEEKYEAR